MIQPTRHASTEDYRYGFQGQEKDDELKGEGNSVNYKYRMHDPRIGRFFAVDPLAAEYPYNGPYNFSENRVIDGVELEGLEFTVRTDRYRTKSDYNIIRDKNLEFGILKELNVIHSNFGGRESYREIDIKQPTDPKHDSYDFISVGSFISSNQSMKHSTSDEFSSFVSTIAEESRKNTDDNIRDEFRNESTIEEDYFGGDITAIYNTNTLTKVIAKNINISIDIHVQDHNDSFLQNVVNDLTSKGYSVNVYTLNEMTSSNGIETPNQTMSVSIFSDAKPEIEERSTTYELESVTDNTKGETVTKDDTSQNE